MDIKKATTKVLFAGAQALGRGVAYVGRCVSWLIDPISRIKGDFVQYPSPPDKPNDRQVLLDMARTLGNVIAFFGDTVDAFAFDRTRDRDNLYNLRLALQRYGRSWEDGIPNDIAAPFPNQDVPKLFSQMAREVDEKLRGAWAAATRPAAPYNRATMAQAYEKHLLPFIKLTGFPYYLAAGCLSEEQQASIETHHKNLLANYIRSRFIEAVTKPDLSMQDRVTRIENFMQYDRGEDITPEQQVAYAVGLMKLVPDIVLPYYRSDKLPYFVTAVSILTPPPEVFSSYEPCMPAEVVRTTIDLINTQHQPFYESPPLSRWAQHMVDTAIKYDAELHLFLHPLIKRNLPLTRFHCPPFASACIMGEGAPFDIFFRQDFAGLWHTPRHVEHGFIDKILEELLRCSTLSPLGNSGKITATEIFAALAQVPPDNDVNRVRWAGFLQRHALLGMLSGGCQPATDNPILPLLKAEYAKLQQALTYEPDGTLKPALGLLVAIIEQGVAQAAATPECRAALNGLQRIWGKPDRHTAAFGLIKLIIEPVVTRVDVALPQVVFDPDMNKDCGSSSILTFMAYRPSTRSILYSPEAWQGSYNKALDSLGHELGHHILRTWLDILRTWLADKSIPPHDPRYQGLELLHHNSLPAFKLLLGGDHKDYHPLYEATAEEVLARRLGERFARQLAAPSRYPHSRDLTL